jgi:hypothetical protein
LLKLFGRLGPEFGGGLSHCVTFLVGLV